MLKRPAQLSAVVMLITWFAFPAAAGTNEVSPSASTNLQTFQVKGVVVGLEPDGKTARIKHEEIPGYMGAMTMPLSVRDTNELSGLAEGDAISFRMLVTDDDGWIDQVKKLASAAPVNEPPAGIRFYRDVEPLVPGDPLPEYHFTNQFGKVISTTDFKGQALAITFIFTRCPFPTFCPRMTAGFVQTQNRLKAMTNAPTNWHLLSISIDPAFDTPATLKAYGVNHGYDPKHWTLATGSLTDISAIGEHFQLSFWADTPGGLPNHNLRTVVIDASGCVQTILTGNTWTSDQLAQEIIAAAAVHP